MPVGFHCSKMVSPFEMTFRSSLEARQQGTLTMKQPNRVSAQTSPHLLSHLRIQVVVGHFQILAHFSEVHGVSLRDIQSLGH